MAGDREKLPKNLGQSDKGTLGVQILQSLRQIIRFTELHSRYLAANFKVTGPQLICLLEIQELGRVTSGELSKRVHVSPSTIVGILDRLEAKELITRTRDLDDRRRVYSEITDRGRELCENAPSPLQERFSQKFQTLEVGEQKRIADSLEQVVKLMDADSVNVAPMLEPGSLVESADVKEAIIPPEVKE